MESYTDKQIIEQQRGKIQELEAESLHFAEEASELEDNISTYQKEIGGLRSIIEPASKLFDDAGIGEYMVLSGLPDRVIIALARMIEKDKTIGRLRHDLDMVKNNRDGMQKRIISLEAEVERAKVQRDQYNQELLLANARDANLEKLLNEKISEFELEMGDPRLDAPGVKHFASLIEGLKIAFDIFDSRPTTPDA